MQDNIEQQGSGHPRKDGERGSQANRVILGSTKYEKGRQEGYLAVKEMFQAIVGWQVDLLYISGEVGAFPNKNYNPSFGTFPAALREIIHPPNESRILYLVRNIISQGTPAPRDPRVNDRGDPANGLIWRPQNQYGDFPNEIRTYSEFQSFRIYLRYLSGMGIIKVL